MRDNKDYLIVFMKTFFITLLLVVISSFLVIYASFQNRQLFIQLQVLNSEIIEHENQKGQLLLEYSTWSSLSGLEKIARDELSMREPATKDIIFASVNSVVSEINGKNNVIK